MEPATGQALPVDSFAARSNPEAITSHNRVASIFVAWFLAIFFAVWAMRGATATDITSTDQARHALNGAALLDMVREGGLCRPVAWMRDYFAHFPAVSMPYHPPLFPAVEATVYAALGVSPMSARLTVAGFVAGAVLLFFHQLRLLENNSYVATACVIAFFSLRLTQTLSADVMLELPALFWVLASTIFIVRGRTQWRLRDAILAGVFAGAAVWTKQAVFVGILPLLLLMSKRFAGLRSKKIFVFYAILGTFVTGYVLLGQAAGFSGISKSWTPVNIPDRVISGIQYYAGVLRQHFGAAFIAGAIAVGALFLSRSRKIVLLDTSIFYLCWLASAACVLLAVPAHDERYLWFTYPALVALAITTAHSVIAHYVHSYHSSVVVFTVATLLCIWNLRTEPWRVTGPAAAASLVGKGGRILYCGISNGSFIFGIRMLDKERTTHVIRADKVVPVLSELGLPGFIQKFGISTVIAEANQSSGTCDDFRQYAATLNAKHESVPIRSNLATLQGTLEIYRMPKVSPPAKSALDLPIESTGQAIRVEF